MRGNRFRRVDRRRLQQALRQVNDARVYRRVLAVLLVARGFQLQVVADLIDHHWRSVARWVHRYRTRPPIDSLEDAPRSGRPRRAQALNLACLWRELQRSPLRAGYPRTVWTVDLLAWYLKRRYRQTLTPRTLRRRLKQWGLRWKRARYTYAQREPHVSQKKGLSFAG
jgi:transposase